MSLKEEETHTHTLTHTYTHALTHTNGSRLKGEVTLSSLQKLETSHIQGFFFFALLLCMKAKIMLPMASRRTREKLLRMFGAFFVELQVHLVQK